MQPITKLIPHKKVHFIGIGGVGMSALAQLLLEQGYWVSGSDIKSNELTKRLETQGALIFLDHKAENIDNVDIIVRSSCIKDLNPEVILARQKGIKLIHRAQLLAALMQEKSGIAVAGAHGKTTTTALISLMLQINGMSPTFAIGADVGSLGGNAQYGLGKYFVAEADESDGSFLYLKPNYAVITNIDKEHLDYYKDLEHIKKTYTSFIKNIQKNGLLICCGEDKNIAEIIKSYSGKIITYGFSKNCDIYAFNVKTVAGAVTFKCIYKGDLIGEFRLNIPGIHNVLNSLAVICLGVELEIDRYIIEEALNVFSGANRRFQIKQNNSKIMIVDDYAHHPTEIEATLKAAKSLKKRRVIGVFQPHRYSRTKFLKKEFGKCFSDADEIVITDIYAASEAPIDGIEAHTIYKEVKQSGHKNVCFLPREKVREHLMLTIEKGDLLMMLGAGDIGKLADEVARDFSREKIKIKT
ncbi:MAG: UDP-N-acetylmuramate--L-alanine ligase [Candidatus Omnitrophota bacterium]